MTQLNSVTLTSLRHLLFVMHVYVFIPFEIAKFIFSCLSSNMVVCFIYNDNLIKSLFHVLIDTEK